MHLVWFKRDLRVNDHRPLLQACTAANNAGQPVIALYVIEDEYWQLPDTSLRQWGFIAESLKSLYQSLHALNVTLYVSQGSVLTALQSLHQQQRLTAIYSHEETGNEWTFERDLAVQRWCYTEQVSHHQSAQFGVKRRLASRDEWLIHYRAIMDQPLVQPVVAKLTHSGLQVAPGRLTQPRGYDHTPAPERQKGGIEPAHALLNRLLRCNLPSYLSTIGSPALAASYSSRLSPYLAYGCISLRQVNQATDAIAHPKRQRNAFRSRLYWHCHFIQKLEDEPSLARQAMHPQLDVALNRQFNAQAFDRWASGNTGVPWVDACMRSLIALGWLNFRMRAMLTSFATYHLWLPWQPVGEHLARMFVDYEPGIHWSQIQMQSGVTGINPNRMYNPVQQGQKYDPQAHFIKRWLPELTSVAAVYCHQPWLANKVYQAPIIEPGIAARQARARLKAARVDSSLSKAVYQKHGSRRRQRVRKAKISQQPDLFS